MMKKAAGVVLAVCAIACAAAEEGKARKMEATQQDIKPADLVWDSPSRNSLGSMPIGNGDIGANVWVEPSGELVLLLSKTDSWDEVSRLCKLGRLRIKLPSVANFRQELRLAEGEILITAGGTTTRLRPDFFGQLRRGRLRHSSPC